MMTLPQARQEQLVVQEVAEETLVYDLKRHRAYSLNRTAGLVWRHCDGQTDVRQMARVLHQELRVPEDEEIVYLALKCLDTAHLLEKQEDLTMLAKSYTRRQVLGKMRTFGIAVGVGVLLPSVISIVAPTAAQAATCIPRNACAGMPVGTPCNPPNCTNICCEKSPGVMWCKKPSHSTCP